MDQDNWKQTIREFEYDKDGNCKPKRIVYEVNQKSPGFSRKDYIDFSFRFISALAIFLPLLIFIQQQDTEANKQKSIYQTEVFTSTISELHAIEKAPLNTANFLKHKEKLISELYPKIIISNDQKVIDTFRIIYDILNFSTIMTDAYGSFINLKFGTRYKAEFDSSFLVPIESLSNGESEFMKSYDSYKNWVPASKSGSQITEEFRKKSLNIFRPIAELLPSYNLDMHQRQLLQFRINRGLDSAKVIGVYFRDFIKTNLKAYTVNFDTICLNQLLIKN